MKNYHNGFISELDKNEVFCFGSNLVGLHLGGAAKLAKDKFGAIDGQAWGLQGQSFAIPTLCSNFQKIPLKSIKTSLLLFKKFVEDNHDKTFYFTPIGTGIAGFTHDEIKSILPKFSSNVIVDKSLL